VAQKLKPARMLDPAACVTPQFRPLPSDPVRLRDWQKKLREKLARCSGLAKLESCRCEPEARWSEGTDQGRFHQHRVEVRTATDFWVPVYLLKPKDRVRNEVIIAFHGHGRGKDEVAGIPRDDEGAARIARLNYDYGRKAAERGYVTVVPDMRGFGELSIGKDSCRRVNASAIAAGLSLKALHVWDSMRLIDWLQAEDWARDRPIGTIGLSGGGGSALWLAAMDERVQFAVIASFLKNYAETSVGCSCNLVPGQLTLADRGELAALIPPRPLYVQSGLEDPGCPPELVRAAFETARQAAKTLGCCEPLLELHPGGHCWSDSGVWEWLDRP